MAPALPQELSRWLNILYPSYSSSHVFEANSKNKRRQLLQQRKQQPVKLILIAVSFVWILLSQHIYIVLTKLLTLHCILENSNVTQTLQKSDQNLSLVTHGEAPPPHPTPPLLYRPRSRVCDWGMLRRYLFKRNPRLQLWKLSALLLSSLLRSNFIFSPGKDFFGAFSGRWQALSPAAKLPSMPCGGAGFVQQS